MTIRDRRYPFGVRASEVELFWQNVVDGAGCQLWIGSTNAAGAPTFRLTTPAQWRYRQAHGVSVGRLRHICGNKLCVSVLHLEPWNEAPLCRNGHRRTPEGLRLRKNGSFGCKACESSSLHRHRTTVRKGQPIDLRDIFLRDGGICQICQAPVDNSLSNRHPHMKTLDHIFPIARGGLHTLENVQLAHLVCNQRKGAAVQELHV